MANDTVTYDLIVNGALVPIQGLTIGINYDGPYIPEFEYVDFTGSPEIATTEGSATKRITIV